MIQIGKTFQNNYPKSCGSDIGSLSEWDQIMYWLLSWSITLLLVAYGRIIITPGSGKDGNALRHNNNSALALMNTVGATDGISFSKNFLNVGISNPDDELNKRTYFVISQEDQGDFTNVPPGLFKSGNASAGVREVYRISQNLAMIKITEIHPVPGTQYFRTYNNGAWNSPGWKVITPE